MAASCTHCGIEHLSLGRLLRLSDSRLLLNLWEMIQDCHARREWQRSQACPQCTKDTIGIPFEHGGAKQGLIVCPGCYTVAMKSETLRLFEEAKPEFQEKRLLAEKARVRREMQQGFREDLESLSKLLDVGLKKADHLLNETPLREIRGTVAMAVGAAALSVFTMLLPYASMDVFGSPTSSSFLSSLTHVTSFHLAWNLVFFCALGAPTERAWGTAKYIAFVAISASLGLALGRLISPFPDAPAIGLSPVIGALLGRHLVLGVPVSFRIPNAKIGFVFETRVVAFVFALSELRTMVPTSGGMRWFTASSVLVAGVLAAAYTEWERRRLVEQTAAQAGRPVVYLHPDGTRLAVRARASALRKSKDSRAA
jgi:membrane associated rhomboid family serine protease